MVRDYEKYFEEGVQPLGYAANRLIAKLEALKGGPRGYTTGLSVLDEYVMLAPSTMVTIAARSATGKTALGMQIVGSVVKQLNDRKELGYVVVFSAEMDTETLLLREACAIEEVSMWLLQRGKVGEVALKRVVDRVLILKRNQRLLVDQSSSPTLEYMIEQLEIIRKEYVAPIRMILFDYAELAGEFDKSESLRIAKISRGLKALSKKFDCPVVTLSQLNRDIEGRENKRPSMRDLMYGGEREPDCIMVMVRPGLYDEEIDKSRVDVTVIKNRNGPTGECHLKFLGEKMRFASATIERTDLNGNG